MGTILFATGSKLYRDASRRSGQRLLGQQQLPPSADHRWPRQAGVGVFTYPCAIPFDHEVLHPAARLRWAFDLILCLPSEPPHVHRTRRRIAGPRARRRGCHVRPRHEPLGWRQWQLLDRDTAVARLHCVRNRRSNRARAAAAPDTIREASSWVHSFASQSRYMERVMATVP